MAQKQRLDMIRKAVKSERRVVVADLSRLFDVTEETIRRDLDKLEEEGLVARTYGGAVLNADSSAERIEFLRRAETHPEEKRVIASLAARVIPQTATIAADASSTVVETLQALKKRAGLTVLTYSVRAISQPEDTEIRFISSGGLVDKSTYAFTGPMAQKTIGSYRTEIVMISCKALNMDGGIYDSNEDEVELKKTMIAGGQKTILLADHSKFDRIAFVRSADIADMDMVITDKKPSDAWCRLLEKKKVRLLYEE